MGHSLSRFTMFRILYKQKECSRLCPRLQTLVKTHQTVQNRTKVIFFLVVFIMLWVELESIGKKISFYLKKVSEGNYITFCSGRSFCFCVCPGVSICYHPWFCESEFFLSSCCDIDTFVGSHPVDILDLAGCFKSSSFLQPLQFHFLVDLTFQLN